MTQQPPTMTPEQAREELKSSAKKRTAYVKPTLKTLERPELWKDDLPEEIRQDKRDH
jgi:hypothetical protein